MRNGLRIVSQFNPIAAFLQIPLPAMVIFAIAAGLIAVGFLSFFFMKNLPEPEKNGGEYGDFLEEENFWKKKRKDMGGWT